MMKKTALLLLCLVVVYFLNAQDTATFEELTLNHESFWNGSDGSGKFSCGNFTFHNSYNKEWGSWSGFAYSNKSDTVTPDWTNQFSAIKGCGVFHSRNYAVAYDYGMLKTTLTSPGPLSGLYITNNTYAYMTMLKGDSFTDRFGGLSGNEPDYFRLKIIGINSTGDTTGMVFFYLADFRFDDPGKDYIIREWTWVDLSALGIVSELRFSLESSDTGPWGMMTPAYFCVDNLNHHDMAPIVSHPLQDISWNPGDSRVIAIQLDSTFADPDDPGLSGHFSVASYPDENLADVVIKRNGDTLTAKNCVMEIHIHEGKSGQQNFVVSYTSNGRTATDTFLVRVNTISASGPVNQPEYRVYPNPFYNSFTVETTRVPDNFRIFNSNGVLLFTKRNAGTAKEFVTGLENQPPGIYFIQVHAGESSCMIKLIKQNK
jgi:hypothetical protein